MVEGGGFLGRCFSGWISRGGTFNQVNSAVSETLGVFCVFCIRISTIMFDLTHGEISTKAPGNFQCHWDNRDTLSQINIAKDEVIHFSNVIII